MNSFHHRPCLAQTFYLRLLYMLVIFASIHLLHVFTYIVHFVPKSPIKCLEERRNRFYQNYVADTGTALILYKRRSTPHEPMEATGKTANFPFVREQLALSPHNRLGHLSVREFTLHHIGFATNLTPQLYSNATSMTRY